MPTHTASRACCLIASLARMHARAECIACSGPHASGVPTRTAEQNREICWRVADGRFGPLAGAAGRPLRRRGRWTYWPAASRTRRLPRHLPAGTPGRRSDVRRGALLEHQRLVLVPHEQCRLRAEVDLVAILERVRLDRRVGRRAASGVLPHRIYVVGDLAAVVEPVDAAAGGHRGRRRSRETSSPRSTGGWRAPPSAPASTSSTAASSSRWSNVGYPHFEAS